MHVHPCRGGSETNSTTPLLIIAKNCGVWIIFGFSKGECQKKCESHCFNLSVRNGSNSCSSGVLFFFHLFALSHYVLSATMEALLGLKEGGLPVADV